MEVRINVSDRDVNRIIQLGFKSSSNLTEDENKELDRLIRLVGTAVVMKILGI